MIKEPWCERIHIISMTLYAFYHFLQVLLALAAPFLAVKTTAVRESGCRGVTSSHNAKTYHQTSVNFLAIKLYYDYQIAHWTYSSSIISVLIPILYCSADALELKALSRSLGQSKTVIDNPIMG
jgi:hypothetical protein